MLWALKISIKSSQACGILVAIDGAEGGEVHCLKSEEQLKRFLG